MFSLENQDAGLIQGLGTAGVPKPLVCPIQQSLRIMQSGEALAIGPTGPERSVATDQGTVLHLGDGIRRILDNGARFMGIGWLESALAAVYFAVMARYLGPSLYGQWAYGIAAYGLVVGLSGFGLDSLILVRLGRNSRDAEDFVGLTLTLRLAVLGLGAVVLMAYEFAVAPDLMSICVLLLFLPALVGRGVAVWARICFLGYGRMSDYAWIAVLMRGAEAVCGIFYLVAGGGLLGVVVLHSLSWAAEALCGVGRMRSHLTRFRLCFAWRPAREMLGQGAALGVAGLGFMWLVSGPIILLRQNGIGMAPLGQFGVVLSLTMILVNSVQAFFTAVLPVLSLSVRQGASRAPVYGRLTTLAVIIVSGVAAGAGWWLGPPLAVWALGAAYLTAGTLVAPFLLIAGAVLAPIAYSQSLVLAGVRWPLALADFGAALWLAISFAPAAAAWGVDGAVASTASAWLLRAVVVVGTAEMYAWRARRMPPIAENAIGGKAGEPS